MSTPIWLNDPTIILKHDKLSEFWPKSSMSIEEKVNAITRLIILLTILGYMLTLSLKILAAGIITLVTIVILYFIQSKDNLGNKKIKESFNNNILSEVNSTFSDPKTYNSVKENLSKPTPNNPVMNVLLPEIQERPNKKGAAPAFNPSIEGEINKSVKNFISKEHSYDKSITEKLFNDMGDDLMFDRSMRQWYSTPNTRIPNDQDGFAKFAYGSMISGKEGNKFALERNQSGSYNYTMY